MKSIDKYVLVLVASLALLLAGCGGGSTVDKTPPVDPGPTPVETAQTALMTAQAADGKDGTNAEMLAYWQGVLNAADALVAAQKAAGEDTTAAAKVSGAAQTRVDGLKKDIADAADDAKKKVDALTVKLWPAIGTAALTQNGTTAVNATSGVLTVASTATSAITAEDKSAMVADMHGWTGSKHTGKSSGDSPVDFTARLYSNVGESTPGAKFSTQYSSQLTNGVLNTGTTEGTPARVDIPSYDLSAGVKTYEATTNPTGPNNMAIVAGTYHGVSGNYTCTPGDGNTCAVQKATSGYNLGGVNADNAFGENNAEWKFVPTNVDDTLMETPDALYAYYGWWIQDALPANSVSAFYGYRAESTPTVSLANLVGSATYKGGAAGQYVISTGSDNDAGEFTADATLTATFGGTTHSIEGTIDNFKGNDGMDRNWSVALAEGTIATTTGVISLVPDGTTWTRNGTAGDAGGMWQGSLYENDAAGVPQVGAGRFQSTYGNIGRMVGAFGVDKE